MDKYKILDYVSRVKYSFLGRGKTFSVNHEGVEMYGSTVAEVVFKMLCYDEEIKLQQSVEEVLK